MKNKGPVALIILDGFGLSDYPEGDATKLRTLQQSIGCGRTVPMPH